MTERIFFMIESGKALNLIKHHIGELLRMRKAAIGIAKELGASDVSTSRGDGVVVAAQFNGPVHQDFKKPDRWGSRPKKGTEWARRFAEQKGYENESYVIAREFNVPLSIEYKTGTGSGSRRIGYPLQECGFLFLGKNGPYAMWIPNVQVEVKRDEDQGYVVEEPAKSYVPLFDGCRAIEIEEWEILVAQHNLAEKKKAKQSTSEETP